MHDQRDPEGLADLGGAPGVVDVPMGGEHRHRVQAPLGDDRAHPAGDPCADVDHDARDGVVGHDEVAVGAEDGRNGCQDIHAARLSSRA